MVDVISGRGSAGCVLRVVLAWRCAWKWRRGCGGCAVRGGLLASSDTFTCCCCVGGLGRTGAQRTGTLAEPSEPVARNGEMAGPLAGPTQLSPAGLPRARRPYVSVGAIGIAVDGAERAAAAVAGGDAAEVAPE